MLYQFCELPQLAVVKGKAMKALIAMVVVALSLLVFPVGNASAQPPDPKYPLLTFEGISPSGTWIRMRWDILNICRPATIPPTIIAFEWQNSTTTNVIEWTGDGQPLFCLGWTTIPVPEGEVGRPRKICVLSPNVALAGVWKIEGTCFIRPWVYLPMAVRSH